MFKNFYNMKNNVEKEMRGWKNRGLKYKRVQISANLGV